MIPEDYEDDGAYPFEDVSDYLSETELGVDSPNEYEPPTSN